MTLGLIGRKLGMTQIYDEEGNAIPVTVLQIGPCVVVDKKTNEKNGYTALQLGYEEVSERKLNKPQLGVFLKRNLKPMRYLKEFRTDDVENYNVGDVLTVEIFKEYASVNIRAKTKGKGFQGVMRRYGYRGGPAAHGSTFHRAPGSIGQCAFPSRVWKNKGMPGHMGNVFVTTKNLKIVKIYPDKNLLLVKGAVPGAPKGLVYITGYKKIEEKKGNK